MQISDEKKAYVQHFHKTTDEILTQLRVKNETKSNNEEEEISLNKE